MPPRSSQLGGKGAYLAEMARCGLNVPPGFTITTEVCQEFYRNGKPVCTATSFKTLAESLTPSARRRFPGLGDLDY